MATEPYGTFFPSSVGSVYSPRPPGQPEVLTKLSNLYNTPMLGSLGSVAPDDDPFDTRAKVSPVLNFGQDEIRSASDNPFPTPRVNLRPEPRFETETDVRPTPSSAPVLDQIGPNYIPTSGSDYDDILSRFKPETRAQDEYFNLIRNMPKRPEPSLGSRITAGLATMGRDGMAAAEDIKYGGYNREVGDYKVKADMLNQLASAERSGNTNERLILSQIMSDKRAQERLDLSERGLTERERQNQFNNQQASRRQELRETMYNNPQLQAKRLGNGNYGLFDSATGEFTDTGVKAGLSPLEDMFFQGQIRSAAATEAARRDIEMEKLRQQHRVELEKVQNDLAIARSKATGASAADRKVGQYLLAQEQFNLDPENEPFIILGEPGTNAFEIVMPTAAAWGSWGADTRQRNAKRWISINRAIYGNEWKVPPNVQNMADTGYPDRTAASQRPPVAAPPTGRRSGTTGGGPGPIGATVTSETRTEPAPGTRVVRREQSDKGGIREFRSDGNVYVTYDNGKTWEKSGTWSNK